MKMIQKSLIKQFNKFLEDDLSSQELKSMTKTEKEAYTKGFYAGISNASRCIIAEAFQNFLDPSISTAEFGASLASLAERIHLTAHVLVGGDYSCAAITLIHRIIKAAKADEDINELISKFQDTEFKHEAPANQVN
jgi:hypothetical protein